MECYICGSYNHNTLDHKERNERCNHEIMFGNKCLKCNLILNEPDLTEQIQGTFYSEELEFIND